MGADDLLSNLSSLDRPTVGRSVRALKKREKGVIYFRENL